MKELAFVGTGATPSKNKKDYYGGNIAWISSGATKDSFICKPTDYITIKALTETNCQVYPIGTLIMAMYGEGKTRGQVSELSIEACTNQACAAIIPIVPETKQYIKIYLQSQYFYLRALAEGGNQPNLNLNKIASYLVPFPPLEEQKRIVAEIDRWFKWIDELEQNQQDLHTAIKQAKSKILDLAIHGKLVPQESKWKESKVIDLFDINPKVKADDDLDAGFVPMTFINDGYRNSFSFETKKWGQIKKGYTLFQDGDIAVAKISPCLENRKSMVVKNLPNGIGSGTTELFIFRTKGVISPEYGLLFFKSKQFISNCVGTFNGVVGQQRVARKIIEEMIIPYPSCSMEQKRIVSKIEELFTQLDKIEESLN